MIHIDGWVFNSKANELATQNQERYKELKETLPELINVVSSGSGYAQRTFNGTCPPDLSEKDLAVYLDRGNLCFGGRCSINARGEFICVVYTD